MSKFICLECGTIFEPLNGLKILKCVYCSEKLNIQSLYTFRKSLGLSSSWKEAVLIENDMEESDQILNCVSGKLGTENGYLIMFKKKLIFALAYKNKYKILLDLCYETLWNVTKINDSEIELVDSERKKYYFKPRKCNINLLVDKLKKTNSSPHII